MPIKFVLKNRAGRSDFTDWLPLNRKLQSYEIPYQEMGEARGS